MNIDKKFKHVIKRLNVEEKFNVEVMNSYNALIITIRDINDH